MVTLKLTDRQAQSLAGLISLGVSGLGAQIAQGGLAALKEGARVLSETDAVVDLLNTALMEAAEGAAAEAEAKKDKAA